MKEKQIHISRLSQLTLCGIIFIFIILISGCFLQKGNDAAADLAMLMLLPTESDEKTEPYRLMDVYEVRGFLTNDSILHETMWGAAYAPHLELDAEEVIKIESKDKDVTPPVSTKNEYLKITCRQVSEDYNGIYDMGETTAAALDKKISIQGAIYRCGDNWYICDKDETEIYCDANGKKAYDYSHIQLMNLKTDEISKSK